MNENMYIEAKENYIRQLEEENMRLKHSIKSLRNNNKGLLSGFCKVQKKLDLYIKKYGNISNGTGCSYNTDCISVLNLKEKRNKS